MVIRYLNAYQIFNLIKSEVSLNGGRFCPVFDRSHWKASIFKLLVKFCFWPFCVKIKEVLIRIVTIVSNKHCGESLKPKL